MQTAGMIYRQLCEELLPLGESAKQQAFWLLEAYAGVSRTQIVLNGALELTATQQEGLAQAVERLLKHEPLQYVLGRASFWGYDFKVSTAVLIPRPETEELVQRIVQRHRNENSLKIFDVCTGSGCIGLTLAKELPQSQVWASDLSIQALEIARYNREKLGVKAELIEADALKDPFLVHELDVVVSNPPYVLQQEAAQMAANVLEWEPHLALFVPDNDPLLFYRAIAAEAFKKLKAGGWLYFEINEAYGSQLLDLLQGFGYYNLQLLKDMQGKTRMAEAQRP